MDLKHLIVHVDKGARAKERVALAVKLAARHGARLTGLFADQPARVMTNVGKRSAAASTRAARSAFEVAAGAARVKTEWWELDYAEPDLSGVAARFCRYGDLTLLGQHDAEDPRVPARFPEVVFLESGRPVLVVPAAGTYADVGKRVVIAWDGSRESARALHDALPLLGGAEEVRVALLRGRRDKVAVEDVGSPSVLRHLQAHGLRAEYEQLVIDERTGPDAMGAVLNLCFEASADLVVIGGRGSHGTVFPRATKRTRASLAEMTAPVLTSA